MVFSGKIPFYRDLGLYFYPIAFSVGESLKNGELPLWNRHMAMGFPLLADFQSGAFYPPNLLYAILPFFVALRAIFLFHYLVAATGAYALCRYWGYPIYLSLLGAFLFAFGGLTVSLVNLMNHFQTAVWLPWVVLLCERALRSGKWRDFLAFTGALLLQFLAGSPEIYLMSAGLVALDSLRVVRAEGVGHLRALYLPVAANLAAFGLAMVQILPTFELFLESRWREPMGYVERPLYSLNPVSFINLFFLDKEVSLASGKGLHLFFLQAPPFLLSYYLGVMAVIGFIAWLFCSSLKGKGLVLGLLALSLVLALGGYTPVYPLLLRYLSFMQFFRFPEKFFFVTTALLLFAALRGVSFLAEPDRRSSRALAFTSLIIGIPLVALYLFLRSDSAPLSRFIAWTTQTPLLSTPTLAKTSAALVNAERQLALVFGALLLFFVWHKGKLRARLFEALIVALVFIDLAMAHRPYQFLLDPDFVSKSPRVLRPDSEPYRLFYHPGTAGVHPSYYVLPREPSFIEFQALVYSNLLPNAGVFDGFDYAQEIDALRRWPYMVFVGVADRLPPESLYRLLGALNIKYVVSFRPLSGDGLSLVRHFPDYQSWLYALSGVVPRAYVVARATEEKDPVKAVSRLATADFDPTREVIVNRPISLPPKRDFRGEAGILRYADQEVTVRASLNAPGLLVLADAFYPGWRAYVNGRESEIYRANLFFRAVRLEAGEHVVEFRYEPRSFAIGAYLSLATLGVLAILTIGSALLRKKRA